MIEIKHHVTGAVVYRSETADTIREAVIEAAEKCANLSGANLSGADLSGAYLSGADLSGAYLSGAYLRGADLRGAYLSEANLSGAYLSGADLRGAYLSGAYLSGADLSGAYLSGANLSGANLRGIRDDLYAILAAAPNEVPALLAALREGRVDGSVYTGSCSCLIGTIAAARGVHPDELEGELETNANRPAEVWFMPIEPGQTPGSSQIVAITVEWVEQWMRDKGLEIPETIDVQRAISFARANLEQFRSFRSDEVTL